MEQGVRTHYVILGFLLKYYSYDFISIYISKEYNKIEKEKKMVDGKVKRSKLILVFVR